MKKTQIILILVAAAAAGLASTSFTIGHGSGGHGSGGHGGDHTGSGHYYSNHPDGQGGTWQFRDESVRHCGLPKDAMKDFYCGEWQ